MKQLIRTITTLNNLNEGEPAEVIMRVATLPADIILGLIITASQSKAGTSKPKDI